MKDPGACHRYCRFIICWSSESDRVTCVGSRHDGVVYRGQLNNKETDEYHGYPEGRRLYRRGAGKRGT